MNLYKSVLKSLIPEAPDNLRQVLDLLGLEVKSEEADFYNIEILANRGDHLSHINVAKELANKLKIPFKQPRIYEAEIPRQKLISEVSKNTYVFYIFRVRISPFKGLRLPINFEEAKNPLINLANYVMIETGQPLHCYSAGKINPPFYTEETEGSIIALDGKSYSFPPGSIFVKDQKSFLAAAGIIGSLDSALQEDSFDIYLEAACFDPTQIRKSRSFARIQTDASYYFERGVASDLQEFAARRFFQILKDNNVQFEILGFDKLINEVDEKILTLRESSIRKHLLDSITFESSLEILEGLEFEVISKNDGVAQVRVPKKRYFNVEVEEDLIQEIARFFNFNQIPKPHLTFPMEYNSNAVFEIKNQLSLMLTSYGFYEVVTRVFINPTEEKFLRENGYISNLIALSNSCDTQYAFLRGEATVSLVKAIVKNLHNFVLNPKIFEFAKVFLPEGERTSLFFAFSLPSFDSNLAKKDHNISLDFGVNVFWSLLSTFNLGFLSAKKVQDKFYDFGICVEDSTGRSLGKIGLVSPELLVFFDSPAPIFVGEINFENLVGYAKERAVFVSDQPKSYRDINVVSVKDILFPKLCNVMRSIPEIVSWRVIDRYHETVTVRLYFQSQAGTLTNSITDELVRKVEEIINHS